MRRETTKGRIRIQRRVVERRHGSKGYQYPIMTMTIPARFHHIFEKLLDFEFDVSVIDHGAFVRLILTGRQYRALELMGVDLELAKERKLEIILRAHEPPDLQKRRSSYWGIPEPLWIFRKRSDYDQVPGQ